MSDILAKIRRTAAVSTGLAVMPFLGGCLFVTDTSRMNADVFARETAPVFYNPAMAQPTAVGPVVGQPTVAMPAHDQRPPQRRELYQTQFHQTYGLPVSNPMHRTMYGERSDDGRMLPAIPFNRVDPRYLRQEVGYSGNEAPGTIVVDTQQKFLYLVQADGKAIRYGIGIGRDGYAWSGRGEVRWKAKWPRWTPPDDMVSRQPELRTVSAARGGMDAGLNNPLGARALYIFKDGKDTLYRVHGTPDWQSVGKATSSGCIRMFNQDVVDLFERVTPGAQIVVI